MGSVLMWEETIAELRKHGFMQPDLREKYQRFCEIQSATCLMVDPETVARFRLWLDTGKDEDAWA